MAIQLNFSILDIPDPNHTGLRLNYGDVHASIFSGWNSMLRMIAELEPDSLRFCLCYHFTPDLSRGIQGRLRLWIKVISDDLRHNLITSMVQDGPVAEFYSPRRVTEKDHNLVEELDWSRFRSASEVIRRINLIESYVPTEENSRVPRQPYKGILPLVAREDNDFMAIDRLLSGFDSEVYAEIIIKPTVTDNDIKTIYAGIYNLTMINESIFHEPKSEEDRYRRDFGFMKDHFAENVLREYEDYAENLIKPQVEFCLRIFGEKPEEVQLVASTMADCAFDEGKYRIIHCNNGDENFQKVMDAGKASRIDYDWQHSEKVNPAIRKFTRMASLEEISGLFRFPVASNTSPRTIRKHTDPNILKADEKTGRFEAAILMGDDIESGMQKQRNLEVGLAELFDTSSESYIEHRLKLDILKKHMFICGVPGSGKTTAAFNILLQLFRHDIPFLVLESAKTEYRILKRLKFHKDPMLKKLGEAIQIYTPGNEEVSPFRFNPLALQEGISADEHMNNLMNCFQAAMSLPEDTPLPALLGKAIEEIYDNYDPESPPYLEDLVSKVKKIMDSPDLAYDSEIKGNLRTAIEVRLSPLVSKKRSIGKIFSREEKPFDIEEIMERPCILEMDSLNTEQSNLLTLFVLTSLREYVKANRLSGSPLKHVIILEEAHNVVGNIPEGADPSDPRKQAADYITRMLAELRALGEGMVIADQLPSTVASAVIKNTGTKLAHRLTSMDDREEIGYTMLLGGGELEDFARLQVGESFYYTEGLYRPRRLRCINSNVVLGFVGDQGQPPDHDTLYMMIEDDGWFRTMALRNFQDDLVGFFDFLENTASNAIENLQREVNTLDKKNSPRLKELQEVAEDYLFKMETQKEILLDFKDRFSKLKPPEAYKDTLSEIINYYKVVFDSAVKTKARLDSLVSN